MCCVHSKSSRWRQKLGFLVYGIVFQLRPLAVCGLLFVAFQAERLPTLQELLGLGSVVVLMSNIPSLGGIGPREAALVAVFSGYTDPATLLSIGLLMSFAVQVFPALLGIPMMFPLLEQLAEQKRGITVMGGLAERVQGTPQRTRRTQR